MISDVEYEVARRERVPATTNIETTRRLRELPPRKLCSPSAAPCGQTSWQKGQQAKERVRAPRGDRKRNNRRGRGGLEAKEPGNRWARGLINREAAAPLSTSYNSRTGHCPKLLILTPPLSTEIFSGSCKIVVYYNEFFQRRQHGVR